MGMILRIASSRIVGQGDIVGRSGYFSLNLSANSVMRGRLDARRTLKSLVADLRFYKVEESFTFFFFSSFEIIVEAISSNLLFFCISILSVLLTQRLSCLIHIKNDFGELNYIIKKTNVI